MLFSIIHFVVIDYKCQIQTFPNKALLSHQMICSLEIIILFTGRAFLFKRVVNLTYSHIQDRVMLTGRHMVRDVMCKTCNVKLGWMYEFATDDSQMYVFSFFVKKKIINKFLLFLDFLLFLNRYKEGRVILEQALINESDGFLDPYAPPQTNQVLNSIRPNPQNPYQNE